MSPSMPSGCPLHAFQVANLVVVLELPEPGLKRRLRLALFGLLCTGAWAQPSSNHSAGDGDDIDGDDEGEARSDDDD